VSGIASLAQAWLRDEAGDDALARGGVEDPAAWRKAWRALAGRAPEGVGAALAEPVLAAARPEQAARLLAELSAGDPPLDLAAPGAPRLARVLGCADFLARRATRLPEAVAEVAGAEQLAPRDTGAAHARLAGAAIDRLDTLGGVLRRNRYAEMFRITARDLDSAPFAETARELSDLADASIACGLRATEAAGDVAGQLTVFAMGKLGGRELNYSSDVDLIFTHGDGLPDALRGRLSRAVTSLRRLLAETTEEGFAFRVDLDLRPEGRAGPLVNSAAGLVEFYETFGRTWERVAWIRARPCAGDMERGRRVLEELLPFVYRRYGSYDVLNSVRDVKRRIEADARDAERNVKLGPGGIREAEFVVQVLQSLYGGRNPPLRTPNTGEALTALAELEVLAPGQAGRLRESYVFLRRVEHAIQMAEDRQTQQIPSDTRSRRRLARRLGYADADADAAAERLERDLAAVRASVREAFGALLAEQPQRPKPRRPEEDAWARACAHPGRFATALVEAAPDAVAERTRPAAQRLAAALFPDAAAEAARLATAPDAAPALGLFLAADPDLVSHLVRRPFLVRAFTGDPDAGGVQWPDPGDLEASLDALRLARRDAFVRAAAGRIRGELSESDLEAELTAGAEAILARGLALARRHGRSPDGGPEWLCILGLGKLGSREMTFHSDLDLVFLYEPQPGAADLEAQESAARLAQKLIHYLVTPTNAGRAYEIDTRLRPSGHGGPLVASLEAFGRYHEKRAQVWEAQALLRARAVAGDADFGREVERVVQSALFEFLKYPDLGAETLRMRKRIEDERARTGPDRLDLKYAAGGIIDAEFLAQYLALREGPRRPALRSGATPAVLRAAGEEGLLRDAGDALASLETLRRVESALRLVTGRAESVLELGGPATPVVVELAGGGDVGVLAQSVRAAQERLREIFSREVRA